MSEVTTKSTLRQILHNAGTGSNSQLISIKHSDLRYLLQELLRNLTQARNSPTLTNAPTDNSNYTQTTQHEVNSSSVGTEGKDDADITMFIYLGLFFLWYGGFIYGCLIGMGVYNKRPKSATLYQRFVERGDIREELRKRKEEMVQHRRMQRRASNMSQQTIAGFNLVSYDRSPKYVKCTSHEKYLNFETNVTFLKGK